MVQFDHFVHCCCVMALFTFDEVDLIDFITPSLADTPPFVQKNNNVSCDTGAHPENFKGGGFNFSKSNQTQFKLNYFKH